ncbi:MAG: hypothetical protein GEU96_17960 [Propionibacteriales bacterium]|nr:hypothetical protein [Propionibacteriales bacterium]
MDFDAIADELYGLPPGEFTATRNALVKEAKSSGNQALATRIQKLAKPTASAWLVNQLVRQHRDDLEPLIALGDELREAASMLTGDELRALTRQRRQVVAGLVVAATRLAGEAGQPSTAAVQREVQQSLEASLADPTLAEQLLAARLARPLAYAGFGELGAGPVRTADGSSAPVADLDARRRKHAQRDLAEASRQVQIAERVQARVQQEVDTARAASAAAEARVDERRAQLADAEQSALQARSEAEDEQQRLAEAVEAVAAAKQAEQDASARLTELGGG